MEGENTPPFPAAAKNLQELIEFANNIGERKKWMAKAKLVIERNERALRVIEKAGKIDKLYAEAADLKDVVLTAITEREAKLKTARAAFNKEMSDKRAKFANDQTTKGERIRDMEAEATQARTAAKANARTAEEANSAAQATKATAETLRESVQKLRDELKDQVERGRKLLAGA